MNILMLDLMGSLIASDLQYSFIKLGHKCKFVQYVLKDKEWNEDFAVFLKKELQEGSFDMVFSTNYYPVVSKVCYLNNIVYCSWVYDSPPEIQSFDTLSYSTNRIFFFCKYDYAQYKQQFGLDTVYYLPLGVNTDRLDEIKPSEKYVSDFALVGGLYKSGIFLELKSIMTPQQQQYMDAMIQVQITRAGSGVVDAALTEEVVKEICDHYKELSELAVQPNKAQLFYAICAHITHLERVTLLRLLGDKGYHTRLYFGNINDQDKELLSGHNVEILGNVNYGYEMPQVFKSCKVNLNPVLRANRTAIPLRALDVMGGGGFLLSSHQAEFDDFFMADEVVTYENLEEAIEKARYYLSHESERKLIARKGYERVKKDFSFIDRANMILEKTIL